MFRYLIEFSSALLFILLWVHARSFVMAPHEIRDLQEENPASFAQEVQAWRLPSNSTLDHIFSCYGTPVLGNPFSSNLSFANYSRIYSGFGYFKSISLTFDMYIIQKPEAHFSNDLPTKIRIAGNRIMVFNVSGVLDDSTSDYITIFSEIKENGTVCGFPDQYRVVLYKFNVFIGTMPGPYIYLDIICNNIPNTRYCGMRNLRILSKRTATTNYLCSSIQPQNLPFKNRCTCPVGTYNIPVSYNCAACHQSCENCYETSEAACLSCKSDSFFDGTLCSKCHSNCKTCIGPLENNCLSCREGYFFNGTHCTPCHPTCKTCSGLLLNQCITCESGSNVSQPKRFLYEDGTCIDSCEFPLLQQEGSNTLLCKKQICHPTCKTCSGLLPNQCLTCESGSNVSQPKRFLYEDGTCSDSCEFPLLQQEGNNTLICKKQCNSGLYYEMETNTCTTCLPPYTITERDGSCSLQLRPEELKQLQTLNSLKETSTTVMSTGLAVTSASMPGDSGAISVGMLTKMLKYIRYLNISHSARLERIFKNEKQSGSPLGSVLEVDKQVQDKVAKTPIPPTFAKYKVHSDFFVNYWDNVPLLGSVFFIWCLFKTLSFLLKNIKQKTVTKLLRKLVITTQNLVLTFFYASYGDIILFAGLELRVIALNLPFSIFSFAFCLFLLVVGSIIIGVHVRILLVHQNLIKKFGKDTENEKLFQDKNEGFKVFFFNFKDNSFFHEAFLLIFIIRVIVFHLILVTLFEYPLLQINIILSMNIGIIIYLVLQKPMKRLIDLLQQVSVETLLLVINISLFILAILDAAGSPNPRLVESISEVIIMINVIFSYLPLAFIAAKAVIGLKEFIQSQRANKTTLKDQAIDIKKPRPNHKQNESSSNMILEESKVIISNQSIDQLTNLSTLKIKSNCTIPESDLILTSSMLDQSSPTRLPKRKVRRFTEEKRIDNNIHRNVQEHQIS